MALVLCTSFAPFAVICFTTTRTFADGGYPDAETIVKVAVPASGLAALPPRPSLSPNWDTLLRERLWSASGELGEDVAGVVALSLSAAACCGVSVGVPPLFGTVRGATGGPLSTVVGRSVVLL